MGQESIHVLASLLTVLFSGLVGLIVTWFNNKIFIAVTKLDKETSKSLSEIRETQMQIKTNQEGHAELDEQRHTDHDRRIIRLEDRT